MDAGLLNTLKNVKLTSHKRRCTDNDFVDRVNCYYTPLIISIFTVVICAKSYIVGSPLQCWVPNEFSKGWEKFAESYCYIKNTYYVPRNNELPSDSNARRSAELQYYQWVPFVLALQSMLFLLPAFFWQFANWQAKLHIKPLVERSVVSSFESGNTRIETLKMVSEHIKISLFKSKFSTSETLKDKFLESRSKKCFGIMNSGCYLTICYFLTKIFFIVNILAQFLIVQSFLRVDLSFGSQLIHKLINGSDWQETGVFPRVTFCDFSTHQLGQPISYTMQCVLVINLFNEKIYIFLWFWFVFLLVITIISLFMWAYRMLFGRQIRSFVSKKSEYNTDSRRNQELLLCQSDMTTDAFFVLRIIEENCGMYIAKKIAHNILNYYKEDGDRKSSPPPNYHDVLQDKNSQMSSET